MAMFQIYALDEQTKILPIVDTASGSIATFNTDLTENLVEVKCQIVAQQASGTPTPDNPLPIQTYTEMNVFATGKNHLPLVMSDIKANNTTGTWSGNVYTVNGVSFEPTIDGDGNIVDITVNGTATATSYFYVSKNLQRVIPHNNTMKLGGCTGGGSLTYALQVYFDTSPAPFTNCFNDFVAINSSYYNTRDVLIVIRNGYAATNLKFYPMVYASDETQTTFEPFNRKENIQFGQTVANGVLDVTTGKLRATHGCNVYDGSENWTLGGGINFYTPTNADNTSVIYGSSLICSHAQSYASSSVSTGSNVYIAATHNVNFQIDSISHTVSALQTWLANEYANGTPFTIVYPLATPIEIQLDSITLQALLNENNIWCDTGDTEVKYLLSVGKKIA